MDVKNINIQDYTYHLPDEKIALYPLEKRDESKLLVYREGKIGEDVFKHIDAYLPEESLIVFNNTRVIHARILFNRSTGAQIEVFCIEPLHHSDYQLAFAARGNCTWKCMIGNAKRWKEEKLLKVVETPAGKINLNVEKKKKEGELFVVEFTWNPDISFAEVLHHAGVLPLPPYLNRTAENSDEERYQTIYASMQGSVAAPTAGLHFTNDVFQQLASRRITAAEVTLHVGAGTFRPVKAETLSGHDMHEESVFITLDVIKHLYLHLLKKKKIIAVGTTATRTLESLYWHGLKLLNGEKNVVNIRQWDAYEAGEEPADVADAFKMIIDKMESDGETVLQGSTQIIIAPGYRFKVVDILITNFHQPENTLILLIAAFTGDDWRSIYDYALHNNFRFLSYGDSSVLFRSY
jgi:S-adenosylmethionine:tRNA ribosyltransferase-isomerase